VPVATMPNNILCSDNEKGGENVFGCIGNPIVLPDALTFEPPKNIVLALSLLKIIRKW